MSHKASLTAKILSALLVVGGLVLVVMGAIAWNMTSSEMSSQKIDVAPVSYELDGKTPPKDLKPNNANGPFDALQQIDLIKMHIKENMKSMGFPENTQYSQVPMPDSKELAACQKDMSSSPNCADDVKNDSARSFLDNGNMKIAELYESVMAFGVSALVMGMGVVLFIVAALGFIFVGRKPATSTDEAPATTTTSARK